MLVARIGILLVALSFPRRNWWDLSHHPRCSFELVTILVSFNCFVAVEGGEQTSLMQFLYAKVEAKLMRRLREA